MNFQNCTAETKSTESPRKRRPLGVMIFLWANAAMGILLVYHHTGLIALVGMFQIIAPLTAVLGKEVLEHKLELGESTKKLIETENQVRQLGWIVMNSNEAIYSRSVDGYITSWNRGAERLLGYSAEEMLGQHVSRILPPAVLEQLPVTSMQALDDQTDAPFDSLRVRKDGTVVDVSVIKSPIRDENSALIGISVMAQNITHRKEGEKRMNEFHSMVSHELRTPLTSIRGALALISDGIVDSGSPEARELIDIAKTSSVRLIRLINDLLDLRQVESGTLELMVADYRAADLLRAAEETMRGLAEDRHVKVKIDVEAEAEHVMLAVDQVRITQVLANLISNAIKFSPENSTIELSAQRKGGCVRLAVKDYGCGIAPAHHGKLFGKFQQVDSSDARSAGGSGLGLSICKAIVELHRGRIGFDSVENEGSTFWIELDTANQQLPENTISDLLAIIQPSRGTSLGTIKPLVEQAS